MLYDRIQKLVRIVISGMLCIPMVACSSGGFKYVAREELGVDPLYMLNQSDMRKPKNYGAVKFQDSEMETDEGSLYILQKKKGIYQAETMFRKGKDSKLYFSFGMDYKKKIPHIGVRLEF